MKLIELLEARSNPDKNSKEGALESLRQYKGRDDIFVSFTDVDKIGFKVDYGYETPAGIYAYPIDEVIEAGDEHGAINRVPFAGERPYVWVLQSNPTSNLLDVSNNYSADDYARDREVLKSIIPSKEKASHLFQPEHEQSWTPEYYINNIKKHITDLDTKLDKETNSLGKFKEALKRTDIDQETIDMLHSLVADSTSTIKKLTNQISELEQELSSRSESHFGKPNEDEQERIITYIENQVEDHLTGSYDPFSNQNPINLGDNYDLGRLFTVVVVLAEYLGYNKKARAMRSIFLKLGYQGFIDRGDSIVHKAEPSQAVFFNKQDIKVVDRLYNKDYKSDDDIRNNITDQEYENGHQMWIGDRHNDIDDNTSAIMNKRKEQKSSKIKIKGTTFEFITPDKQRTGGLYKGDTEIFELTYDKKSRSFIATKEYSVNGYYNSFDLGKARDPRKLATDIIKEKPFMTKAIQSKFDGDITIPLSDHAIRSTSNSNGHEIFLVDHGNHIGVYYSNYYEFAKVKEKQPGVFVLFIQDADNEGLEMVTKGSINDIVEYLSKNT